METFLKTLFIRVAEGSMTVEAAHLAARDHVGFGGDLFEASPCAGEGLEDEEVSEDDYEASMTLPAQEV